MFIKTEYVVTEHTRLSKLGVNHSYKRKKTVFVFRCDSCSAEFKRDKGSMDPNRINNNVYHVCSNCDAKRFAQSKGVENKYVWDMPVSSLKTLDQL
jgi:DNA-directed RNA polymerase subunit RPC12/RpoP